MERIPSVRRLVLLQDELLGQVFPDLARIDEHPARAWKRDGESFAHPGSTDEQVEPAPVQVREGTQRLARPHVRAHCLR
jgi:hypothetical protein